MVGVVVTNKLLKVAFTAAGADLDMRVATLAKLVLSRYGRSTVFFDLDVLIA